MTLEELKRNLKYEMNKHKNDKVYTCGTNISAMCRDTLEVLEAMEKEIRAKTLNEFMKKLEESELHFWKGTMFEHGECVSETKAYTIGAISKMVEQMLKEIGEEELQKFFNEARGIIDTEVE